MNTVDFLQSVNSQMTVNVEYQTIVKLPKKYGIFGIITKNTKTKVQIGSDYETEVNKVSESEFTAKPTWGVHINSTLVEYKDKYYMEYFLIDGEKSDKTYYVDGEIATPEQIEVITGWEKSRNHAPKTQTDCGVKPEDIVQVRKVAVENIINLAVA